MTTQHHGVIHTKGQADSTLAAAAHTLLTPRWKAASLTSALASVAHKWSEYTPSSSANQTVVFAAA